MIVGRKASGYFVTFDGDGHRIEGETRQCAHCQFTWVYRSGDAETQCAHCRGMVCGRAECLKRQFDLTGNKVDCVPFEDHNNRRIEKALAFEAFDRKYGKDFVMNAAGVLVPVE